MAQRTLLDPVQLRAYFALIEVVGLLRHSVEQQLKDAGDLSYVQFQLLARLGDTPTGSHRMTDLADGVVYSRSGLTYQAGLLEKAGLVTRSPSPDDERSVTVAITDAGRAVLEKVFPGHADVIKELLFAPLSPEDTEALADLLGPVRDHMRSIPPRSAAPRRTRDGSLTRPATRRSSPPGAERPTAPRFLAGSQAAAGSPRPAP